MPDTTAPDTRPTDMPESTQCNCAALRQASRRLTKFYDAALASTGLGINQYSILSRLNRHGPKGIQELAAMLAMDRSTLGHLLRPLEKRNLVRLTITPADKRRRVLVLTAEGQELVAQAQPLWTVAQRQFEQAFGSDNALALRTVLRQVETANLAESDNKRQPAVSPDHQ
ncbi:MarR family winged helix-turn-helix transcriptional regulator [Nitrospirillum sp. BR 11163]|uniref:MarR family winged helix-turn-helix transcriptional regulator n=1 Tax=Nitrospirillum sp. BR 11163 TaxID=3104323 RepID=UPI002B0001F5|nr:MarR family winged helix-turn-helix transcriptional regulator [Nitrospirillum sp. BR 11163]MEA1675855.1 MarR family winged helix-turn-helix transcriptional regulator [Nitrospirillum sp. BR 11163]